MQYAKSGDAELVEGRYLGEPQMIGRIELATSHNPSLNAIIRMNYSITRATEDDVVGLHAT
jgi:hypothetical protein